MPARLYILRCCSLLAGLIIVLTIAYCFPRAENLRAGGNRRCPRPSPPVALRCHLPIVAIETKVSLTMYSERMAFLWSRVEQVRTHFIAVRGLRNPLILCVAESGDACVPVCSEGWSGK
jgi:hypothetical protein